MPTPNANREPDTVATIVQELYALAERRAPKKVRGTKMFAASGSFATEVEALALRLAVATCETWIPANTPPPPQLVSDSMTIIPLLLSLPRYDTPQAGWYVGGLLQEWRIWGSPNEQHPTHWRPLPKKPS